MKAEKQTRVDSFHRAHDGAFTSLERERYAKARARGDTITAASAAAGVSSATGTNYEKHEQMRKRISELRQGAETFIGVSNAWVINQLKRNAEESRDQGAFKASNESIHLIYKIMNENKDLASQMARSLPPDVSPKQLKSELNKAFAKPALPPEKAAFALPEAPREDAEEDGEAAE